MTLQHGKDSLLLNDRGLLKTVSINATEQIQVQVEVIETLDFLIPVGFNVDVVDFRSGIYKPSELDFTEQDNKSTKPLLTVISHD